MWLFPPAPSDTPRRVTLVRNPDFHEWSHAAQPDGYPDRVVWRIGASTEAATTTVEHNAADYTMDPPPTDPLNEVNPNRAGVWNAPDLIKAHALIAASGTRGTPITIFRAPEYLTDFTAAGR